MGKLKMPDLNTVTIAGRVAWDPEIRHISNDKMLCKIRIANTRFYKSREYERREDTTWVDVVCWDKTASFAAEYCKKGRAIIVEGRLKSDEWEDKDTGQKRTKMEITANRVTPIEWDDDGEQHGAPYTTDKAPYTTDKAPYTTAPAPSTATAQRDPEPELPQYAEDDLPF